MKSGESSEETGTRSSATHVDEGIDGGLVEREDGLVRDGADCDLLDAVRAREAHRLGDVRRDLVRDQDDAHVRGGCAGSSRPSGA